MVKFGLVSSLAALAVVLSGCGGSSESMSDKNYIVVLENVPSGVCESDAYRDILKSYGFEGLKTEETSTDTGCETYGKSNDGETCVEEDYDAGDVNCVVGFNNFKGNYDEVSFRKTDSSSLDFISSTLLGAMQDLEK